MVRIHWKKRIRTIAPVILTMAIVFSGCGIQKGTEQEMNVPNSSVQSESTQMESTVEELEIKEPTPEEE